MILAGDQAMMARTALDNVDDIPTNPDVEMCKKACEDENRCRAWTFGRPGYIGPDARSYLKEKLTTPRTKPCCISGVVR